VTAGKTVFRCGQHQAPDIRCAQPGRPVIPTPERDDGTTQCAYRILQTGSSADRQLATFQRTGGLKDVVDQLVAETSEGLVG
jgi:hypothetical protein